MSDERARLELAINGLNYALTIVSREIINAAHHQEIQGLNRAQEALRDEVARLKQKLADES